METVSGDLSIRTAAGAAIAANTVSGDITLGGAGTGRSLARPGGAPALTLHSTSGDIAIATQ